MEFKLTTIIEASPQAVYEAWLSSETHGDMTGGEAHISAEPGSSFSAWDGYIEGAILELKLNKRIYQSWRTTEFSENEEDSFVEVLLSETDGNTELTLIHTNLPAHGEQYRTGWKNHYFQPMKEYFSS